MTTSANEAVTRILVVEDEILLAMDLQDQLEQLGYCVVGPAGSVNKAHEVLDDSLPDAAILDVNLNGESVSPIARRLMSQNIPCLIVSAYRPDEITDTALIELPKLEKPTYGALLKRALEKLLS